jgi:hypothetical protein
MLGGVDDGATVGDVGFGVMESAVGDGATACDVGVGRMPGVSRVEATLDGKGVVVGVLLASKEATAIGLGVSVVRLSWLQAARLKAKTRLRKRNFQDLYNMYTSC